MENNLVPVPIQSVASADLEVSETTRDRIRRSVPENTRKAYSRQWDQFTAWCTASGRSPLPATAQTLAEYVSHMADLDRAPSTIEQAIAAIRTAHRTAGHRGLPETDAALAVLKVHKRDRAAAGKRKRKAPPVTLAPLRAMIEAADPETLTGKRDRVLLVLGFSMMARRSELAALRIEDVRFTDDGLTVLIRTSKTDQAAEGAEVNIPNGVHPATDPVRVVRAWLKAVARAVEELAAKEPDADQKEELLLTATEGPLLRRINRWGQMQDGGLSGAAINERVQALAAAAGLDGAELFTAHGLRAGGPTEAAKKKTPVAFIAAHGRWSPNSPQVHGYVRAVDDWEDNPMRGIGL